METNIEVQLQTEITAKFLYRLPHDSPQQLAQRQKLQEQADLITERLQTTFRLLVIEMLDIQRIKTQNVIAPVDPDIEEGTDA